MMGYVTLAVSPETPGLAAVRAGQEIDLVLACTRKERLVGRSGSPYLALEFRDRSATLPGRAFRDADLLGGRFERGDLVRVRARVERFREDLSLDVVDVGPAPADTDPAAFLPVAYRDITELDGEVGRPGARHQTVLAGAREDAVDLLPGAKR